MIAFKRTGVAARALLLLVAVLVLCGAGSPIFSISEHEIPDAAVCDDTSKPEPENSNGAAAAETQANSLSDCAKPDVITNDLWELMKAGNSNDKIKVIVTLRLPTEQEKDSIKTSEGVSLSEAIRNCENRPENLSQEQVEELYRVVKDLYKDFFNRRNNAFIEKYSLSDGVSGTPAYMIFGELICTPKTKPIACRGKPW
jgi:hypothetical protein